MKKTNPYEDDLKDLMKMIKPLVVFSLPHVQRKMFWGYNRARNTINLAIQKGDAEIVREYQGIGEKYQFKVNPT